MMHLTVVLCTAATIFAMDVAPEPTMLRRGLEVAVPEVQAFEEPTSGLALLPEADALAPADAVDHEPELQAAVVPERQPASVGRTITYTLSMMAVGYGILVVAEELDEPDYDDFDDSIGSTPEPDDDDWQYNYVLHPLWGSETYLRAREADFGIMGSIGYSMASSLVWEYLVESWSEHPSTQDLLLTTGVGWLLGEARYSLKQKSDPKYYWLIDPIVTALDYVGIRLTKEPTGETTTMVTWSIPLDGPG